MIKLPPDWETVDLPKMVRKEMRALSPGEVRRFLFEAKSDRWHALWVLLVTTGLRPGEALHASRPVLWKAATRQLKKIEEERNITQKWLQTSNP